MMPGTAERAGPLSHRRHWRAGVVQALPPPGMVDLGPGYLDPDLLPVDLLGEAYARTFAEFGSAALAYGENQGELGLRTELAARAARADGVGCGPEHVLITAGTSHAVYLVATRMAAPGDTVIVEQTGYDFGRRILVDCGLRPREVAADGSGLDPVALDEALTAERAAGNTVAFAYLSPTFHNPTGIVVPPGRRAELLAVAARHGVLVVEDDAYGELGLEPGDRCSLAGLAGYRGVVRLGTVSKTLGPGLRLGWLTAEPAVVDRLVAHGLFVSGGSANHLASLAVGTLLRTGEYDRHLDWLRDRLRDRRDALAAALRGTSAVTFRLPAGGCFLWLTATGALTEPDLLAAAHRAGVAVAAGSRFGSPRAPSIRLSYSFTSPDDLAEAGAALARELNRERR
jgi:enduracididine biosynthesis enzyme MppQ